MLRGGPRALQTALAANAELVCPLVPLRLAAEYAAGYSTQSVVLLRKFFLLYWRNPNYSERPLHLPPTALAAVAAFRRVPASGSR